MALKEYAYWGFGIESPADNPYVREMLEAVVRGKGGRRSAGGGREDGRRPKSGIVPMPFVPFHVCQCCRVSRGSGVTPRSLPPLISS